MTILIHMLLECKKIICWNSSNNHLQKSKTNVSSSSTIATTDGDVGLSWKLIDEDINVLPEFTTENVLQYFIYRKENDGLERQDWKNFNLDGFKLFKEGHIQKYMLVILQQMFM